MWENSGPGRNPGFSGFSGQKLLIGRGCIRSNPCFLPFFDPMLHCLKPSLLIGLYCKTKKVMFAKRFYCRIHLKRASGLEAFWDIFQIFRGFQKYHFYDYLEECISFTTYTYFVFLCSISEGYLDVPGI